MKATIENLHIGYDANESTLLERENPIPYLINYRFASQEYTEAFETEEAQLERFSHLEKLTVPI